MSSDPRFASRFETDDPRVCVVSLDGTLDPVAVEELTPRVEELVRAGHRRFVFDLSGLGHVGSLGLRLLVGLRNQLKDDGAVALCGVSAGVRSMLELTRVNQVLRMYPTRADAVDAVRGG